MAEKIISFILATIIFGIQGQEEAVQLPRCSEHEILNSIDKIPDPLNSKGYFICENDILTLKYCENNKLFNSDFNECTSLEENTGETDKLLLIKAQGSLTNKYSTYTAVSEQFFGDRYSNFQCPSKKTKNYPDEQDCRRYYHCEDQIPRNFTCPTYFLFDVKTLQCQFFLLAICFQPTTTVAPTTYNPPICTHDEDIPYPYDCKHYYHCSSSGNGSLKKCGWFFSFDSDKRKCRFSLFVRCDASERSFSITKYALYPYRFKKNLQLLSNSDSGIKSDRNLKYFAVDKSVNLYESSDVPQCGEDEYFRKPYPGHCKRFYDCKYGVLRVYKCLFIFNFDPISLTCRWFSHVDCNYASPTTSTTILTTDVTSTLALSSSESSSPTSGTISSSSSQSSVSTSSAISSSTEPSSSTSGGNSSTTVLRSSTDSHSDKQDVSQVNYKKFSSLNRIKLTGNKLKMFDLKRNVHLEEYVCRPDDIYDDIYPANCHKFYHCNMGDLTIESCSFFKDFDPIEKRCRLFFLVDCHASPEILTTTEVPPLSTETPIIITTVYTPYITTLTPSTTPQPEPTTFPPSTTFQPTTEVTTRHPHPTKTTHKKKKTKKPHHKSTTHRTTHETTTDDHSLIRS